MTAERAAALAGWAENGGAFVAVTFQATRPPFATAWDAGDVPATQRDAHVRLASTGAVREVVPPFISGPR